MGKSRIALVIAGLAIMTCSFGGASFGQTEGSTGPAKTNLIVFVHGIHGSPSGTWLAGNGAFWPDLVRSDPVFRDADVIEPGYPTPYVGNRNNVADIASDLARQLRPAFDKYQTVIFVCHSLGGLIVKQMLLDHPDLVSKVPFVVFYATPGDGSFIAQFASFFDGDPLLKSMSNSGDNTYLRDLENRWRGSGYATHRFCAYEMRKMRPSNLTAIVVGGVANAALMLKSFVGGIYVVDPGSATYGCDSNAPFTGMDANHIGIVKPSNSGDPIYVLFRKYYAAHGVVPRGPRPLVQYDKVLCAFYGAADQQKPAWNEDETCPIPDSRHLDHSYRQTTFQGSYRAKSDMTAADIPPGLEIQADGGYFWSVNKGHWNSDQSAYIVNTYCGPSGQFEGGCNVKVKIVGHYRIGPE